MSATIHSEVIHIDAMIPRTVSEECEDQGVEGLLPWVFEDSDIASLDCTMRWAPAKRQFKYFFYHFNRYLKESGAWTKIYHPNMLRATESITLPKRNWKVTTRKPFEQFMKLQGMALKCLMQTIWFGLKGHLDKVYPVEFPTPLYKQRYWIGGERYVSRPEGAVKFGPQKNLVPIISYFGWFEGQTWGEYLVETLSAMLGQLASNVHAPSSGQEVFVVGLYGPYLYIARGVFAADTIARVQTKGSSEGETVELKFIRNYNLRVRLGWDAAMRALTRLFRYLMSGDAKVGGMKPRQGPPDKC